MIQPTQLVGKSKRKGERYHEEVLCCYRYADGDVHVRLLHVHEFVCNQFR